MAQCMKGSGAMDRAMTRGYYDAKLAIDPWPIQPCVHIYLTTLCALPEGSREAVASDSGEGVKQGKRAL